ncbi:hypothetical protein AB0958_18030 [Streptomyces sp. NPDC006655]|uniref:hypothetical protein n=1 Tax=Streptomyces sp. NPDC006655 TaxID=3156898 RepID=UPI003453795A
MPGDGSLGLVTVTHRPHPLCGRRLRVRAVRGRQGGTLVCERPGGGLVTVLRSWTDRASGVGGQVREPRGETRAGTADAGAFRVSESALRRLRASWALSVERLVGMDVVHADTRPSFTESSA